MSVHIFSKLSIVSDLRNSDSSSGMTFLTDEEDFFVFRGFGAGVGITLAGMFSNIVGGTVGLSFPFTYFVV